MNDAHDKRTREPKDPAGNHFPDVGFRQLSNVGPHQGPNAALEKRIATLEAAIEKQRAVNEALWAYVGRSSLPPTLK